MTKRLLCALLAALLCLACACGDETPTPTDSSAPDTSSGSQTITESLPDDTTSDDGQTAETGNAGASAPIVQTVVKEGSELDLYNHDFTIIRSDDVNADEMQAINEFYQTMQKYYPSIEYGNDVARPFADGYEVVVGKTNRPVSKKLTDAITATGRTKKYNYTVAVSGKQVYLAAVDAIGLQAAITYFLDHFVKNGLDRLPKNYSYTYQHKAVKVTVGGNSIDDYRVIVPRAASWIYTGELDAMLEQLSVLTAQTYEVTDDRAASAAHEILVGATDRPQSKTLSDPNAFEITVQGGKLVLNGGSDAALASGVIWLTNYLRQNAGHDIVFSAYFKYSGSTSSTPGRYRLVWNDEFGGTAVDTGKWIIREDTNEGIQYTARPENTRVANGLLTQTVQREIDAEGESHYTASHISTKMYYLYGYAEVRLHLPQGNGCFPAFWGNHGGMEYDIFEQFAGNNSSVFFGRHIWWWNIDPFSGQRVQDHISIQAVEGGNNAFRLEEGILHDAWHTIGMVWDAQHVVATFDGFPYFETSIIYDDRYDSFYHMPIDLKLNHIVDIPAVDRNDGTPFPNVMEADYVRLYQIPGQGQLFDAN